MNLIPFVKSTNSPRITTDGQSDQDNTTTLQSTSPIDEGNVGLRVAEIYQSIVSLKTTTSTMDTPGSSADKSTVYCESCELIVRDPGHFRGTAHLVSTQTPQQQQQPSEKRKQAIRDQPITRLELEHGRDSAMQLMEKYGWRPGEGLGKSKQGTRYPVTTIWKQDRLGIGHPRTDRRRITHPSISKTTTPNSHLTSPGSISGKKMAADAKAEAALRSAMLNYMNN